MTTNFRVLAAKGKSCVQDDVRYLTLGDKNPASGNRYYVCVTGKDSQVDWANADMVRLEIVLHAYRIEGQWHQALNTHSVNMIEIDTISNNLNQNKKI